MAKFKLYTAIVLILLLLIVVLQNTAAVETRLLFITVTMPRAALLAITMLIGIAAGMLLALGLAKRFSKKNHEPQPTGEAYRDPADGPENADPKR